MPEYSVKQGIKNLQHVAIIMDGNGRWAEQKGLPRFFGHRAGIKAFRKTVKIAKNIGIRWLTVYAFSSENWSRPSAEVDDLMHLMKRFIHKDLQNIHKEGVKVQIIGDRKNLSPEILELLEKTENLTSLNTQMNLIVAFNYGGRNEIVRAVQNIVQEVIEGKISPEEISMDLFSSYVDTSGIPDPDLVIRTSGEMRLSNFLLWQIAYSEFVFLPCLWPDFNKEQFLHAIQIFQTRDRRFGNSTKSFV